VRSYNALDQRVASLVLPSNNLCGRLPDALQWLDRLKTLALPGNALTGPLPPAFSSLTSLAALDLSSNQLSGVLHARLFEGMHRNRDPKALEHQGLRSLNVAHNQLWGQVPNSVSTLRALALLNLANNHLSQRLPEGLSCCTALKALRLSDNKFTGSLPDLASCSRLLLLEAANNHLGGQLPPLPVSLTKLHLQGNKLVRDLPATFFKCLQLADVNLSDNFLSGAVSDAVGDLRALWLLKLAGNRHSDADKGVIQDCLSAYLPDLVRQGGFKI
jgi:Leucine-rich repeat (LRR) protein